MTPITQFRRYMWLVDLLHTHGALTRSEIDYYWSRSNLNDTGESRIPKRTFMRMKNDIGLLFGIYIECQRSRGNRYALENDEDIKKDGSIEQWLINGFSINNVLLDSQSIKDRIVLENIPSGNRFLTLTIEAMQQNRTLSVQYQSFVMNEPQDFEIAPYCIRCFKQRWYVLGAHDGAKEPHFYSLDRVLSMEITDNTFKLPKDFNTSAYFHNYYGVMQSNTKPELVRIRTSAFRANYLRSLPLHHSQKEIETTSEYSVFEYYIAPTTDFTQELRSILPEINVLEPQWLRDKFRGEAQQILRKYS